MILLNGSSLTIAEVVAIVTRGETVAAEDGAPCPRSSSGSRTDGVGADASVYGINTGVGSFAEVKISCDRVSRRLTTTIRRRPTSSRSPNRSRRASSKTRVVL
jgi:histidine ammonia-lyase